MVKEVFKDIAGQEKTVQYFVNAFKNNRLTHAYLISGASAQTREEIAHRFAFCILKDSVGDINNGEEKSAYSRSFSCPDIHQIKPDGAGSYLIEQIRQVSADANLAPIQFKKKVYIFHDADCLWGAPANALLKTLEEPPSDVVCILLAQNYASVLQTLQSRCVLLKLSSERFCIDEESEIFEVLYKIANRAKNSEIFDAVQKIKENAQNKGEELGEDKEEQFETYKDYFSASAKKELDTRFKREQRSIEKEEVTQQLMLTKLWLRDCLLLKNGALELMSHQKNLEQITQVSAQCCETGLLQAIDAVKRCEQKIYYNVGLDLALEAMFFEIRRALCQ